MILHTSERMFFKKCRQLWDFTSPNRQNLEPDRTPLPLWFGTGIHKALDVYYEPSTPRDPMLALDEFRDFCALSRKAYEAVEGELWVEQGEFFDEQEALGLGMLDHYFSWCSTQDDFEVVFVEKELLAPVTPKDKRGQDAPVLFPVHYSFKPDGLVIDPQGRYWLLEHKTAIQILDSYEWLALDEQIGSYIWGIQKVMGITIEGVIYNVLRKKTPMPLRELKSGHFSVNKQQDTTYEYASNQLRHEYENGVIPEMYQEFLDHLIQKGNRFFKREYCRRNPREIESQENQIYLEASEMINPAIYRNPSRFNCTGCSFLQPCIAKWEGADYEFIIEALYRKRKEGNDKLPAIPN